ncbi:MAG: sulfotransferase family protein [Acidimicrobiales bacterium]
MQRLEHPDWVRRLNYLGDAAGGPDRVVGLDPDELLATARAATGLDDLGEAEWPGWTETYRRLLGSVDAESALHLLGRVLTRGEVLRVLGTWLRLQDRWRSTPALTASAVEAPIFVVGPPRTGTTILFELLALDPRLRAPIAYEALHPLASGGTVERRRALAEAEQELWSDIHPPFLTMHELAADLPCECVHFLMYDFAGPYWSMIYDTPSFTGWQLEHLESLGRLYRLHRRMLQTFAHESPDPQRRRWLLKSPYHVATLPALFAEYPDARVVHTHRDPQRFLPSLVSILSALRFMRSDAVDVAALAGAMELAYVLFLDGAAAARSDGSVPADRVVDSHFTELMADPVGSLHRLYGQLELDWPEGHDGTVRRYLDAKPKGKHGTHQYSAADVGLDPASVRRSFAAYVAHYAVAEE